MDELTPDLSSTAPPALTITAKPQPSDIPLPPSPTITIAASEKSRSSKWDNLPPRDHPVRERKPVESFANLAGTEFGANQAFAAFAEDPHSPSDADH